MMFEAEVIPMFISGIIIINALELIIGVICLKYKKKAKLLFIGHVVSMIIGFVFLIKSIFANWLNIHYDIASISNSVNIGMFGVLWMISTFFVVAMISELIRCK